MKEFFVRTFVNRDVKMTAIDWIVDFLIAAVVFGLTIMQITGSNDLMIPDSFARKILGVTTERPDVMVFVCLAICCAPLLIRRKFSWISFLLCLISWAFMQVHFGSATFSILPLLISLISLCALRNMDDAFLATFISLVAVGVVPFLREHTVLTNMFLIQDIAFVVAGAGAGIAYKTSHDLVYSANLRAEQAEKTAEIQIQQRLEKERVSIARELHDITAHSLSAISIQAAAAEAQLDKDPQAAKDTISNIRKMSKDSLGEIRRMIGVLRDPALADEEPELLPTQGTDEMPELKQYLEAAGFNCVINMDDYEKEEVPDYVDIAIFGICREAATNAVKHSKAKNITIKVEARDLGEQVRMIKGKNYSRYASLEFRDDGVGLPKSYNKEEHHGLEGMRERIYALRGEIDVINALPHGTVIYAVIPITQGE